MNSPVEKQIEEYEKKLKQAMLHSDISELDKLLADDLFFTNHLGQLITKQNDLDAHRSGMLKIRKILFSEQKIRVSNDIAIVSVQTYIVGYFNGEKSENNFRFTRVWSKASGKQWQIIAGHSSIVI